MTEKIEELEYFDPFVSMKDQYDLFTSAVYSCDLNYLRDFFLSMACFDGKENSVALTSYVKAPNKQHKKQSSLNLQVLKRSLDNLNNIGINISRNKKYTKDAITQLNNRIKQLKTSIEKYIQITKEINHDTILYDYLDNINEQLENKEKYRYKVPYVFYLQEIMQTFRIFNDTTNKQHIMFDDWNNIFKLQNDILLFNFQGCLGLLLMNEFCFYYRTNQLKYCILCAMLMTNLYIYSPIYKRIERETSKKLNKFLAKEKKTKADRSRAGSKTKNEAFKQWCIKFNEKKFPSRRQKALYLAEYYQEHHKEIIKEFPDTSLTQEDPYNSIYKWLQKGK